MDLNEDDNALNWANVDIYLFLAPSFAYIQFVVSPKLQGDKLEINHKEIQSFLSSIHETSLLENLTMLFRLIDWRPCAGAKLKGSD